MKKKNYCFRFKQFSVKHEVSSMHVGVDAVLLGAWTRYPSYGKILDVGTGCGVIALIAAQLSGDCQITAIDIDENSIREANENFEMSPWRNRVKGIQTDFSQFAVETDEKFNLIISNPPYFDSGGDAGLSARMRARHQDVLSPFSLICYGKRLLEPGGVIAMILPVEFESRIDAAADENGMRIIRRCRMRGNANSSPKRLLVEMAEKDCSLTASDVPENQESEELIIENSRGDYTDEYVKLCKELYLRF